MPAYKDRGRWRYRKRVTLPDGRRVRIKGTPLVNTKVAAEAAERDRIEQLLDEFRNPEKAATEKQEEVPTLNQFKPEFMDTYVKANNKPGERISKEQLFRSICCPLSEGSDSIRLALAMLKSSKRKAQNWPVAKDGHPRLSSPSPDLGTLLARMGQPSASRL